MVIYLRIFLNIYKGKDSLVHGKNEKALLDSMCEYQGISVKLERQDGLGLSQDC